MKKLLLNDGMNSAKFIDDVGPQHLNDAYGTSSGTVKTPSTEYFAREYPPFSKFDAGAPAADRSYDAAAILGLAIAQAGRPDAAAIRDAIRKVVDPKGTVIHAGAAEFRKAFALIKEGQPVRYVGVIGPVGFERYGDITGPFRLWRIREGQVATVGEMSAAEVDALKAKLGRLGATRPSSRESAMRIYKASGYALLVVHALVSALLAPPELGQGWGLVAGVSYLLSIWFLAGLYLPEIMHMGIAHRALDFEPWFIKSVTLVYNLVGIYVNPRTWVNRHRHHHAFSDHPGDPNKLSSDGFWKTMYLCLVPYPCRSNLARDPIFETWPMRLVSSSYFAVGAQLSSYLLLSLLVRDWIYALALWCSVRLIALWVNMVQNYWTHDRRFGARRYHDDHDNAMNIGDWLPVTATFSACLQNNHHHHPHFLRLSHDPAEYDFGFLALRLLKAMGLVKPSSGGLRLPADIALKEIGL